MSRTAHALVSLVLLMFVAVAPPPTGAQSQPPGVPAAAQIELPSSPFQISVEPDTKMALRYNGGRQFYGTNASGLFLWVGDAAYGPGSIPFGNVYRAYTPLSNTLAGDGSAESPWRVTTRVAAGDTGITIVSITSYVSGADSIEMATQVVNEGAQPQALSLFHAGDLYLEFPGNRADYGYGTYRAASGAVGATTSSGDHALLFESAGPPANAYREALYSTLWGAIGNNGSRGAGFNSTFDGSYHDAAAGLQWDATVAAGGQLLVRHRLRLERTEVRPFDPQTDAVNVPNDSLPTAVGLSRRDFVEVYGASVARSCPASGECVLTAEAEQYYKNNFANADFGGQCFGLSTIGTLFYRAIERPEDFAAGATRGYDLTLQNAPDLQRRVGMLSAFQNSRPIQRAITANAGHPADVFTRIEAEVASGNLDPIIVLLQGRVLTSFGGHALVAYATERQGDTVGVVRVYDPNHAGDRGRRLRFDLGANTWSYEMGLGFISALPFSSPFNATWSGNAEHPYISTLPLSALNVERPQLPFVSEGRTDLWLAADQPGYGALLATDALGRRVGQAGDALVAEIPEALTVLPLGGVAPAGTSYYLPNGAYTVSISSAITRTAETQLQYYAPGLATTISSIDLAPTTRETVSIDGASIAYRSLDPSKEIDLTFAYTRGERGDGRTVLVEGVEVGAEGGLKAELDQGADQLLLQNPGAAPKSYRLLLRFQGSGADVRFTSAAVSLAPGATQRLGYAQTATTRVVRLETDGDGDGAFDSVTLLGGVEEIFLPMTTR